MLVPLNFFKEIKKQQIVQLNWFILFFHPYG